jgi:uncharacterized membrane protein
LCLLLFAALLPAGCGGGSSKSTPTLDTAQESAPAPAPVTDDAGARFRCVGNEPGWSLSISPDSLVFVGDYGEIRAAYAGVTPRTGDGLWYYESVSRSGPSGFSRLTVTVVRDSCSDGMSDRTYQYTVRLIHDHKGYVGCADRL